MNKTPVGGLLMGKALVLTAGAWSPGISYHGPTSASIQPRHLSTPTRHMGLQAPNKGLEVPGLSSSVPLQKQRGAWTQLRAAPTLRSWRGAVTAGSLRHCSLSFLCRESGGGWRRAGRGLPEPSWPKGAPTSPVICVYTRRAPLDTVKGARMRPGEGRTEHGDTALGPTGYAAGAPVGPGCPPGSIHWSLMMGMWGEGLRVVEVFCKKSP